MYAKLSTFALLTAGILLATAQARAQSHQSFTFTDLGAPPPYGASLGQAINNAGEVAGLIRPGGSVHSYQATVWQNNTPIALESLGGPRSEADAINNRGQAAGWAELPNRGGEVPALWNGTKVTRLTTLGSGGEAYAINNKGQVAGEVFLPQGGSGAAVWNGTKLTQLNSLGGAYSYAHAINNRGQVAGGSDLASPGDHHAVVWNGKTATDLGTLGGRSSDAIAINDRGQVVGAASISGSEPYLSHATLWNATRATDLGSLGGPSSYSSANGINNAGVIVGESGMADGSGTEHATLWEGGKIIDLNDLLDSRARSEGWVLFTANGINDEGWIVGSARNTIEQRTHAFLLIPVPEREALMAAPIMLTAVPEPQTYAMFLAGLGLMAGILLGHRKTF